MKKEIVIILIIVCVAFFARTFRISVNPPSLSWDEVSIGYNAYSILKTGKDEHQKVFPLDTFVAYGDYKPPLAVYLTVPFVAIFGLNELAVRLPSALMGTLTVLLTYFLVKELLIVFKFKEPGTTNQELMKNLPLLSAALLAISPWHINLSRAGFEATIALFFVVLGMYVTCKAEKNPLFWIFNWIPFVAAAYTFNSARYFVPMMGLGIVLFFWKSIKKNIGFFAVGVVVAGILMIPIVPHLLSKEARLRFVEVNIFTDSSVVENANARIAQSGNAWWAYILHNRRVGYAKSYILHFLDHFQPEYLFERGDGNPKFSIQDVGQFYMIEAPFLVIGIIAMLVRNYPFGLFLLYWMIVAIIPAAVARETPHALRTLNTLPTWQIFIAYGIITTVLSIKYKVLSMAHNTLMSIIFFLFIILYIFNVGYYIHNYYRHYPIEFSGEWQYGYKDALLAAIPVENKYDTIYVTDIIGRPYMYALFYEKTDPNKFFRTLDASFDGSGFYHVYGFGNYQFVQDMPKVCNGKCLYIAPSGSKPEDATMIKTIHLLNGSPILELYEK